MKLAEWCEETGIESSRPVTTSNQRAVIVDHNHPMKSKLWDLEDYLVSSADGITIWLRPTDRRRWRNVQDGQIFRWPGGVSEFVRNGDRAELRERRKCSCIPSDTEIVILLS